MTEQNGLKVMVLKEQDLDKKLDMIITALSTQATATLNVLLGVISAVEKLPSADKESLRKDIESLKALSAGDDVHAGMYGQIIDLCLMRLDPPKPH